MRHDFNKGDVCLDCGTFIEENKNFPNCNPESFYEINAIRERFLNGAMRWYLRGTSKDWDDFQKRAIALIDTNPRFWANLRSKKHG